MQRCNVTLPWTSWYFFNSPPLVYKKNLIREQMLYHVISLLSLPTITNNEINPTDLQIIYKRVGKKIKSDD